MRVKESMLPGKEKATRKAMPEQTMHRSAGDTFVSRPLRLSSDAFLATHWACDILPSQGTTRPSTTGSEIYIRGEEERGRRPKGAWTSSSSGERGCFGFQSTFANNLPIDSPPPQKKERKKNWDKRWISSTIISWLFVKFDGERIKQLT